MGAWGYSSDENDSTHDILPINFGARLGDVEAVPASERVLLSREINRRLSNLPARDKKIRSNANDRFFKRVEGSGPIPKNLRGFPNTVFAGAVMWALKQGLHLNKAHIQLAKQQLQFELAQLQAGIDPMSWRDYRKRISALNQELADLEKALKSGFGVQRRIRGIGSRAGRGRKPRKSRRKSCKAKKSRKVKRRRFRSRK